MPLLALSALPSLGGGLLLRNVNLYQQFDAKSRKVSVEARNSQLKIFWEFCLDFWKKLVYIKNNAGYSKFYLAKLNLVKFCKGLRTWSGATGP